MQIEPEVIPGDRAEVIRYPDDEIRVIAPAGGDIQVALYTSTDREGPPEHRHPWDEVQIVLDGQAEFRVNGSAWTGGGPGTVQFLPKGASHSVRIPEGEARVAQVSIGPPFAGFARDMARLFAEGAPLERIAEAAAVHGVQLAREHGVDGTAGP